MGHDLYLEGGPLLLLLRSMAPDFKSMLAARKFEIVNYCIPQTLIAYNVAFVGSQKL